MCVCVCVGGGGGLKINFDCFCCLSYCRHLYKFIRYSFDLSAVCILIQVIYTIAE